MAFYLIGSSSNPLGTRESHGNHDDAPHINGITQHTYIPDDEIDMARDKERPRLEIHVDADPVFLKGTGRDVQPGRLSGQVFLYLTESTSVKEITLVFKGKAKLPSSPQETGMGKNQADVTYTVCTHKWSFLEGEKKHAHTLKAGRHFFPFQLQLGGDLPSSISTPVFGGASVSYKLRAQVVRSGFSSNLNATLPVSIIRSFTSEALEYQQSLEIENTWPEKIMYSLTLPHKAWAAGDKLTALVKLCPLVKGLCVLGVNTTVHERSKVFSRAGQVEQDKVVASARHEFVNGNAVLIEENGSEPSPSKRSSPAPPAVPLGFFSPSPSPANNASPSSSTSRRQETTQNDDSPNDIITQLAISLPSHLTPSSTLEPITVTHRIRWTISILNPTGHTSELRCSLPLFVLDPHLLDEARSFTLSTRRLLFGGTGQPAPEEVDMELPSYHAHIRDRVANMFLSDAATVRVTNPWVYHNRSPVIIKNSGSPSGHGSGMGTRLFSHLPHTPEAESTEPLDWVNSELLLSLSDLPPELSRGETSNTNSDSDSPSASRVSRPNSRPASIFRNESSRSSRVPSPEPSESSLPSSSQTSGSETRRNYSESGANRNLQSVFKATLKPFTNITPPWLSSRSHSQPNIQTTSPSQDRSTQATPARFRPSGPELLHHAFTAVPDYGIASRGFLGGVPPLSSMQGLPSYEEAERQHLIRPSSSCGLAITGA